MYDIRDILIKGIELSKKKKEIYKNILANHGDLRVRMIASILVHAAEVDIAHYEEMIKNVTNEMAEGLDFSVFDKISSLVNQFSRRMMPPVISTRQDLVIYAIELEQAVYALLMDIKGRLVTSEVITSSISYYVLLEMITDKEMFIGELSSFKK